MKYASLARAIQKAVMVAAALLAGCGGGSGTPDAQPEPPTGQPGPVAQPEPVTQPAPLSIKNVIVVGAEYSDVGSWGSKVGLQDSSNPAGFPLFSELIAGEFGVQGQCNFFSISSRYHLVSVSERPGCTNFASSSAYITPGGWAPIPDQLAKAAQAQGGSYTAQDLVLVEAGTVDFEQLLRASLVSDDQLRPMAGYLIDGQAREALLAQPRGWDLVAGLYMERLGDAYYENVKYQLLDKGATHVVLLDMPDYSRTPAVEVAMSSPYLRPDAGTLESMQASVRTWVDRFNARLRERVGNDPRIVIVPFHDDFVDVVTRPGDHGLTNVTGQVCWQVVRSCDTVQLDASPPAGLSTGWWQTWLFTSGTQLTPKGQRLLAESVDRALVRAGWR